MIRRIRFNDGSGRSPGLPPSDVSQARARDLRETLPITERLAHGFVATDRVAAKFWDENDWASLAQDSVKGVGILQVLAAERIDIERRRVAVTLGSG
jgi:hypothetical protein